MKRPCSQSTQSVYICAAMSSGFLCLVLFMLIAGLRGHDRSDHRLSPVFKSDTRVDWVTHTVNFQHDNAPSESGSKPVNMGEQPDDDDGSHMGHYPVANSYPEKLYFSSFSSRGYLPVNRDICLPPPKG